MEQSIPLDKLNAVNDIIKDLPKQVVVEVDLPSKNRFYTLKDPTKAVTLRAMNWTDEQAILSAKKSENQLNLLLSRTLDNLDFGQILPIDKLALLLKLREISISDTYAAIITCPHCEATNEVDIKLNDLTVKEIPQQITDPVAFTLPVLGKEVIVNLQRARDEHHFKNPSLVHNNLWRFVKSIAGTEDKLVIAEIIKQLPLKDLKVIIRFLSLQDYGIETKFNFVCSECQKSSILEMPIGDDFFTVK